MEERDGGKEKEDCCEGGMMSVGRRGRTDKQVREGEKRIRRKCARTERRWIREQNLGNSQKDVKEWRGGKKEHKH